MAGDRPRLNRVAYEYLKEAVHRHCRENGEQNVVRPMILKRIERSRLQTGAPLTYGELKSMTNELIGFDDAVLRKTAKLNGKRDKSQSARSKKQDTAGTSQETGKGRRWSLLPWILLGSAGFVGAVWVANLPFPPVRTTVARVAPIVLLPSFMSMDHHYRGAIAAVEQADQLVNNATSAADIELGAQKVDDAQGHLDQLPVWFLGYYPRAYCTFVGCQWRFTFDEFEAARKLVARTEAVVFQERNAQTQLQEGVKAAEAGKAAAIAATDMPTRQQAIAQWQAGIDQLKEVPPKTLAYQQLGPKLEAYTRDLKATAETAGSVQVVGDKLAIAKQYAWEAAKAAQNGPHPPETWERIIDLRRSAVARLKQIQPTDANYRDSQLKMVEYERDLGIAQKQQTLETQSARALKRAKTAIAQWQTRAVRNSADPSLLGSLTQIMNTLDEVQPGTSSSQEAQQLRQRAEAHLKSLQ